MTVEEASAPPFEVWPDNWQTGQVFIAMSSQWRYRTFSVGMGTGSEPTGLDYSVLPEVWRRTKTPIADRDEVFECLRVMETAALEHMNAKKD